MKVTAKVTRSGGWWAIEVPEVRGVFTQAKRLDQVAEIVADAVAVMKDVDPASVEVTIEPALSENTRVDISEAQRLSKAAEAAMSKASAQMRRAVAGALAEGLTVRDVGILLDLSPQRVSQLSPKRNSLSA
ncbi:hypothetical protein EEW87_17595 (plasmid) [Janibacter melonis]|uniref:Uncharacterized protein n=1 Tax=Janibacter melonis TaxID=262209 RepID=A0A650GFJ6_9MICO|nr:hypothetical protein [Janibacter melonis]QGX08819.1 hypothetical protein EEW87_17595 [Janibacter melonis]